MPTTIVVKGPTIVSARTQRAHCRPGRGAMMGEGGPGERAAPAEPRARHAGRPAADRDRQRSSFDEPATTGNDLNPPSGSANESVLCSFTRPPLCLAERHGASRGQKPTSAWPLAISSWFRARLDGRIGQRPEHDPFRVQLFPSPHAPALSVVVLLTKTKY